MCIVRDDTARYLNRIDALEKRDDLIDAALDDIQVRVFPDPDDSGAWGWTVSRDGEVLDGDGGLLTEPTARRAAEKRAMREAQRAVDAAA